MDKLKKFWKIFRWFLLAGAILFSCLHFLLVSFVNSTSEGWIASSGNEIFVQTVTYEKGRDKILLIPMCHVGEPEFYDEVIRRTQVQDLALTEGVNDTTGILRGVKFSYANLADIFGLVEQPRLLEANSVNADGDMANLSEESQKTVVMYATMMSKLKNPLELQAYLKENEKALQDKELMERVMKELIESRNTVLLNSLDSALNGTPYLQERLQYLHDAYLSNFNEFEATATEEEVEPMRQKIERVDKLWREMTAKLATFKNIDASANRSICLPWGAKHMDGFQEYLVADGWKPQTQDRIRLTSMMHIYISVLKAIF